MIGVGIDVSKLKSTICITNEYGEVLKAPYEISHTETDLKELTRQIKGYGGKNDVRVVMEATGSYSRPVLYYLLDEGIFVSEISSICCFSIYCCRRTGSLNIRIFSPQKFFSYCDICYYIVKKTLID